MGSWGSVLYKEVCPGNSADFIVNTSAVSCYSVVELNFYPSLPKPMSADEKQFCEGVSATGMTVFFILKCSGRHSKMDFLLLNRKEQLQLSVPPASHQLQNCLTGAHTLLLLFSCEVVSDSLQSHGPQSSRLLCPWDSSGKNTGVGCHFLLHFNPLEQLK